MAAELLREARPAAQGARILAATEKPDPLVAHLDQMARGKGRCSTVIEAHHHVIGVRPDLGHLNDGTGRLAQKVCGSRRLVGPGHDQSSRTLAVEEADEPLFLLRVVAGIGDLDLRAAFGRAIVKPAQRILKNAVGDRGHDHADGIGAARGQGRGGRIGQIVQRPDRIPDPGSCAGADTIRAAQHA